MTTKQKHTTESVMVYPIDTKRIADEYGNAHPEPNLTWRAHDMALIKEPCLAVIDTEFVGYKLKSAVEIPLWWTERLPDGSSRSCCANAATASFNLADLLPYLLPAVSLAEFTQERQGSKDRILRNELAWLRHFNGID